jgi:general secretion pathway protein A
MYERHWQLTQSPFRPHCGPEFFCRTAAHQAALLKLRFVLEQRQACAALVGPTGVGKSYLLRVLQAEWPASIGPTIVLSFPELTAQELVRYLVTELAADQEEIVPAIAGMDELLHLWEKLLLSWTAKGRLPVIVVDDAHVIEERSVWQTWQLLLTYRERPGIEFSVLFVGQPELVGRWQRFPQLEERLALVCTLPPLSERETKAYIAHRLNVAGRSTSVFDDAALRRIWEHSAGIPRRIDRLCDFSLLVGYADGVSILSAAQIDGVAQELHGRAAA